MNVLVIAEHDGRAIKSATRSAITAARQVADMIAGEVHLLVAGHQLTSVVGEAAHIGGVDCVLHADGSALAHCLAESMADQVVALTEGYSHVLFAATAAGKSVAPRVAALLDVGQISEVIRVVSINTYERPIYAGSVIATVQSAESVRS